MSGILCVGHAVQDYLFRVNSIPTLAEKYQALDFSSIGGGPAANAAVAIARLGGHVMLAARVGSDSIGDAIISDLTAEGVDCSLVHRLPEGKSSLSAILIDDTGQRMIVNYLDCDLPYEPIWLERSFPTNLDAVLVDTRWPEGALFALSQAQQRNIPAILDADHPVPQDGKLIEAATHIAFSAQGLRSYTGVENLENALCAVASSVDSWCCVTDGGNGVLVKDRNAVKHISTPQVKAVDTLGAGDIWHGAFSYFLATGSDEIEAVQYANAAAAIKVTRQGGRKGAPSRQDVDDFLFSKGLS